MSKETAENKNEAEKTAENAAEGGANGGETAQEEAKNESNSPENTEEQAVELTPEEKITELEAQLAETRDQLLRKAADFENFRKRMNQEKQNAIEYANQSLLLDIIPVIDDFERAIQAGEGSSDINAFLEGVKMIEKRLTGQLESKWGLKRFNSEGEPFDPNRHEALMVEKSPEITEAVVREDLSRGYLLKDRVIRTAKVKVLMPED
ncbi:MAG: nucleotide exchange factor GrpE [Treponema sp.]|jgi:molecular chaperone GrpE|nr:nucleotide exchange factor GrpE [Treponema sp.]